MKKKPNPTLEQIDLEKHLPLDSENSIQFLLDGIKDKHLFLRDEEIGYILQHIRKVKLQLFLTSRIEIINKESKEYLKKKKKNQKQKTKAADSKQKERPRKNRSVWVIYTPMGGMNKYR